MACLPALLAGGAVAAELPDSIAGPDIAEAVRKRYEIAISADSFASILVFAMSQTEDVDIEEILFRPTVRYNTSWCVHRLM